MHMKDPAAPQIVMLEEIMGRWAGPYAADNVLCGVATVPVKLAEKRRAAAGVEIDHPRHIERFTQHLGGLVARSEVAIEGQHGDARTLQVANVGLDLGCSPETVHRLMLDHFNDQCVPPWEVDDLAVKVINASKSRENDIGCDALPSSQDAFGHLASNVQAATSPVSSTAQGKASRFKPIRENEMDAIPPPIWLVDNLVEDRTICVVVGESGSFKTFILADLCFSVAAGVKTAFGTMPNRSGPVFYASLEGLANVMQERRQAWREGRSITGTFPFFAMPAPVLWSVAEQEEFVAQIDATGERPALIALETFTTMLDGKENDTESGALFAKFCRGLIERYGCAVVTVHHNSDKDGASKTGRGTSSIKGNCDSMILVEGDPVTRTADVSVLKHRSFAMSAKPWHLRGRPCGPALVFGLITPEEVRAAQIERDPYHPTHIGAALRNLGAVRPDKAVASRILASELVPTERHATVEERDAAIKSATNRINERAAFQPGEKKSLCAYAEKTDRGWYWSLPG
ncbi:AAA family ATPase [Hyphomicrobium methylovorum]|uniref:AAA family ATPase n=1 Tax=Hyphomicrobium methylovorum TaxID=84 RepID=UPI0015E7DF93|nr:AAA family ATPase [Hyphomicrobium methylovorum]